MENLITLQTEEKLFNLFDLQDEENKETVTLQGARTWLVDFWNTNPDDDMTDEEHDEMIQKIHMADIDEIGERLSGIDYWIEEIEVSQN